MALESRSSEFSPLTYRVPSSIIDILESPLAARRSLLMLFFMGFLLASSGKRMKTLDKLWEKPRKLRPCTVCYRILGADAQLPVRASSDFQIVAVGLTFCFSLLPWSCLVYVGGSCTFHFGPAGFRDWTVTSPDRETEYRCGYRQRKRAQQGVVVKDLFVYSPSSRALLTDLEQVHEPAGNPRWTLSSPETRGGHCASRVLNVDYECRSSPQLYDSTKAFLK